MERPVIPAGDRAAGVLLGWIGVASTATLLHLSATTDAVTGTLCAALSLFGAIITVMGADLASGLAVTRAFHRHPTDKSARRPAAEKSR